LKRNNIFMLAYIAFMILSVVIRIFLNYDLWEPLVLAISVSSIFFAIDGFCNSVAHSIKGSCDIASEYIDESRKNCYQNSLFFKKLERIEASHCRKNHEAAEVIQSYESTKALHAQMLKGIEAFERDVLSKRDIQKRYEKWATRFSFAGFLSIFLSLIFEPYINLPTVIQEMISIASFAIVLFSQLIDDIAVERIKKDLKNKTEALKEQGIISEAQKKAEEAFDNYIDLLISDNNEVEEDAD